MKRAAPILLALALSSAVAAAPARNEQDDDFVDAMILHHQRGIEMARLAVEKAQHAELRELARRMIAALQEDIRDLEPMRDTGESRERGELADMPGMSGMDLGWLRGKSGNEFDLAFLLMMIEHHKGGLRMARDEITQGADRRPRKKARQIAARRLRELETMREWQSAWAR
jgi:uncharacterized protein (DUF305 family)